MIRQTVSLLSAVVLSFVSTGAVAETFSPSAVSDSAELQGCAVSDLEALSQAITVEIPQLSGQNLGLVEAGQHITLNYSWDTLLEQQFAGVVNSGRCEQYLHLSVVVTRELSEGPLQLGGGHISQSGSLASMIKSSTRNWGTAVSLPSDYVGVADINQTLTLTLTPTLTYVGPKATTTTDLN